MMYKASCGRSFIAFSLTRVVLPHPVALKLRFVHQTPILISCGFYLECREQGPKKDDGRDQHNITYLHLEYLSTECYPWMGEVKDLSTHPKAKSTQDIVAHQNANLGPTCEIKIGQPHKALNSPRRKGKKASGCIPRYLVPMDDEHSQQPPAPFSWSCLQKRHGSVDRMQHRFPVFNGAGFLRMR